MWTGWTYAPPLMGILLHSLHASRTVSLHGDVFVLGGNINLLPTQRFSDSGLLAGIYSVAGIYSLLYFLVVYSPF